MNGKWFAAIFAAFVILLALFGCPLLGEPPKSGLGEPEPQPVVANISKVEGSLPPLPDENPDFGEWQNNSSESENVPPQPAAIPRNVSPYIWEGEFDINQTPFEPLYIYVINASHADSIFVKKGTFTMLLDAGNFSSVQSFLNGLGVFRINVLVATRDYPGAVGGMADILNSYQIDELWTNNVTPTSKAYKEALEIAKLKGITIKNPQEGDNLTVNGLEIRILNPQKQRLMGNPDIDAIVMRLGTGKFCALLLNPTVQEREPALMWKGVRVYCPVVTVFKHGEGRPTPSLLIDDNPSLKDAIISVGQNQQDLPSKAMLARLAVKNRTVWRTDLNGTIQVYADWIGNYEVSAYKKAKPK